MHILFTDKENEYIDKKLFHWTIKKDCPPDIRKTLEKKLNILNKNK